ncbi:hypothetical protein DL96DRAFT_1590402 [Flagelloscypha sp. PMI_526]|nr:hypothetical protein DL96DRAFT_1590402 [Flagelloscypha sp. PMI_526]
MVTIIRQPELVPGHLRRLIYASIVLNFPALGLSLTSMGLSSWFVVPAATLFTWIYHLVLIIKHNKARRLRTSDPIPHQLLWQNAWALVCGYAIALVWTAGLLIILQSLIIFAHNFFHGLYDDPNNEYDYRNPMVLEFLEMGFTLAATVVVWALAALATHLKRTERLVLKDMQIHGQLGTDKLGEGTRKESTQVVYW